ncbi:MAG TPA: recombinase family protein [Bacilli bacterium]|nr:recombinase family protein [Bacilli bacterium]
MAYEKDRNYPVSTVAVYLRKSRGEEEDLSKHQLILTELCEKNKWKYVEYKEIGSSDSIELRPVMQRLLKDVEEDTFDAVLVVDYDRLSRGDAGQQDRIKKIFKKNGTLIITPNKVYDLNNDNDDTYTDFQGFMARQEYKMITRRLRQGKKIGARQGKWTNGSPPFGYSYERYRNKYNQKGLVINDEEKDIVRYIIDKALEGDSPNSIAWDLNKQEIRTRQGKLWSNVAIYRMLQNETYLGKIISNKQKGDGHKIKKASAEEFRRLPREEWVIVENCHEPIITQEEFDKIQLMIEKRRKIPTSARTNKGEFTGVLKCGVCNHTMQIQRRKGRVDTIKPCQYHDQLGEKCINRGGVLQPVRDAIKEVIIEYKKEILAKLEGASNRDIEYVTKQLQQKYKEMKKYEGALEKVLDAYELGDYSRDEYITRKRKWADKISNLENEITLLEKELKSQEQINDEERLYAITYFLENIDKIENIQDRNKLYKTLLDSVIWKRIGDEEPYLEINFL